MEPSMNCKAGMPLCDLCKVPVCKMRIGRGYWCSSCETRVGASFGTY